MMDAAYVYRAITERVIDGDTYELRVDLGLRCAVSIEGRLHGVDCPERGTDEGKKAKAYVVDLLTPPQGVTTSLIIQTYKNPRTHVDERSFARWIVDVWLPNGENLSEHLLSSGLAKVMVK